MRLLTSLVVAGVMVGALYGLIGFSLTLMFRSTGVLSFAHAGFALVASYLYSGFSCRAGGGGSQCVGDPVLPPVAAALVSVAAVTVLALVTERWIIRPLHGASGAVRSIATAAVLGLCSGVMLHLYGAQPRYVPPSQQLVPDGGFSIAGVVINWQQASIFVASAILIGVLTVALRGSWFGLGVRAAGQSPEVARLMGVEPRAVARFNWGVGGALSGLAGVLIAPITVVNIGTFSFLLVKAVGATLIGGMVSLPLTFAGGIGLGVAETVLPHYWSVPGAAELGIAGVVIAGLFLNRARLAALAGSAGGMSRVSSQVPGPAATAAATWAVAARRGAGRVPRPLWWLAALGILSVTLRDTYYAAIGVNVLFYALIALSVVLVTGLLGQPSLMQMGFAGLGAVTLTVGLDHGLPFAAVVPLAVVVGFVAAGLTGMVALRFDGAAFAILTLTLAAVIGEAVIGQGWVRKDVTAADFFGVDLLQSRNVLLVMGAFAAVAFLLTRNLMRSSFGRSLRSVAVGKAALLRSAGVSPTRAEVAVFGFSGAVAALAGCVYALIVTSFSTFQFIPLISITMLLAAVIGGVNSLWGPVIAGVVFGYGPTLVQNVWVDGQNAYPQIVSSVLALIVVVRAPGGLASLFDVAARTLERARPRPHHFRGPALDLPAEPDAPGEAATATQAPSPAMAGMAAKEAP